MTAQSILGMFGGPVYNNEEEENHIEEERKEDNQIREEDKYSNETQKQRQVREMKAKAKMPLNTQCRCKSGKKYKSCCLYKDTKEE
jgi:hypothetical protein